jgi:hypothetical protein
MKPLLMPLLCLSLAAGLVACPGNTLPANITHVGGITLLRVPLGISNSVLAAATFFKINSGSPTNIVPSTAYCVVFRGGTVGADQTTPVRGSLLDLGPKITINNNKAIYTTLNFDSKSKIYSGFSATNDTKPLEDGSLSVVLPNSDQFAALSGNFPASSSYSLTAPNDGQYSSDSLFGWTSDKKPNARLIMLGSNGKTGDDLAGFSCMVPDSGSFSFDSSTKAELASRGAANGKLLLTAHVVSSNVVKDSTVLTLLSGQAKPTLPPPALAMAALQKVMAFGRE